jgi:D-sedoheptulose 7-phosphate isomerase
MNDNNVKKFFREYIKNLNYAFNSLNIEKIDSIYKVLKKTILNKKQIFVAGNGGSASVANHFLCDFNKGIKKSSNNKLIPKVISLSNSIETITAISNDINYDKIFSFQLENYYQKGDCLICFSSSGQSKNIIDVIIFAKKRGIKTILFQGFGGLHKKIMPDYYINLKYKNYGITEDIFQSIMHAISQFIRYEFESKNAIL